METEDVAASVVAERKGAVLVIRLDKPARLNAWNAPMRARLLSLILSAGTDETTSAIVLTGTGERAFCAGQDLNEGKTFDGARSEMWIEEWRHLYNAVRRFEKPFVIALNGLAAGSAFQLALLGDIRIGHDAVKMGQPEINSGLVSATGFWIIREMLGLSRATELVLTGRMMEARECADIGLIHQLVPREEVLPRALAVAEELAAKPRTAFRLNKQRICAATQVVFDETFEAARQLHRQAFEAGEPQKVMERFLSKAGRTGA
ncbi:enoyl-CoA hydratase/isomerase family protein [Ancylobacter mangrovi]|uniref:enoyl-CoA hydratase/isomerase family protein n=1 Tax=Ancylobacter mangrovi TaxID=2972472 RepID=UPI002163895E|nr:enoyl-CoA hydratase/isomerase family protein [Ancylobacter mangrovi]MCS0505167.1 enoyl-CoA hydratase/isomerase family protein [Ancylobacter mangrovi]